MSGLVSHTHTRLECACVCSLSPPRLLHFSRRCEGKRSALFPLRAGLVPEARPFTRSQAAPALPRHTASRPHSPGTPSPGSPYPRTPCGPALPGVSPAPVPVYIPWGAVRTHGRCCPREAVPPPSPTHAGPRPTARRGARPVRVAGHSAPPPDVGVTHHGLYATLAVAPLVTPPFAGHLASSVGTGGALSLLLPLSSPYVVTAAEAGAVSGSQPLAATVGKVRGRDVRVGAGGEGARVIRCCRGGGRTPRGYGSSSRLDEPCAAVSDGSKSGPDPGSRPKKNRIAPPQRLNSAQTNSAPGVTPDRKKRSSENHR